ncbi:nitrous oxide reductase accessory protein NosL [Desulfocurvibacter africanus]|uniref:nitrous oxide reductase accessory protein NosL n=1 Tax=Desulfocurvibacter africanus TaxID=873 RepID=UPI0003FCC5ED|nr:nitrous oxide reductase accessory protein NosL [Desulfocurvibacter africanus]
MSKGLFLVLALLIVSTPGPASGGECASSTPSKRDKCPVCGMFVYKYPDWTARVCFKNGKVAYFDGAKDMFKYLLDLAKYAPGMGRDDVAAAYVTEYYDLAPLDASRAFFVLDSDVLGPMGRELIPLMTREAAETFRRDHKGKRITLFQEVTPALLRELD